MIDLVRMFIIGDHTLKVSFRSHQSVNVSQGLFVNSENKCYFAIITQYIIILQVIHSYFITMLVFCNYYIIGENIS